jgi:UDP-4-amino-4,6-dideoxy-N-acetyl-beta-L-altrosamine transaminase
MQAIPYGKQQITEEDLKAVLETLSGEFLTQGPKIAEFEEKFAKYVGSKYAVACANGTAALHLCTLALGVNQGDKIITTPITFAASANCVRYCGGEVLFADIEPNTYLIDLENVRSILANEQKGAVKGMVLVDFAGRAVNLEEFRELANEYGCWIIEDSCHAPGGYFRDSNGSIQHCGNGNFADLAIFSFHPVKHIATGEGGMITTNNKDLYEKLMVLRTHGITRDISKFTNTPEFAAGCGAHHLEPGGFPAWYMEMQDLGYNYRLTDFQSALGISQLGRADQGLIRRKEIATRYAAAFTDDFIMGQSGNIDGHAYHLYIIEVENRLGLYNYLRSEQIFAQIHYIPAHLMPYYRSLGFKEGDFEIAENYYRGCISLPMYPTLTNEQQDFVIDKVKSFFSK